MDLTSTGFKCFLGIDLPMKSMLWRHEITMRILNEFHYIKWRKTMLLKHAIQGIKGCQASRRRGQWWGPVDHLRWTLAACHRWECTAWSCYWLCASRPTHPILGCAAQSPGLSSWLCRRLGFSPCTLPTQVQCLWGWGQVGMHHVRVCSALAEVSSVLLQGPPLHPREAGCLQLSEAGLLGVLLDQVFFGGNN